MIKGLSITKEQVIEQIRDVYETDLGDFKRKASLYLNRFSQFQKDPITKKRIQSLKNFVLYSEETSQDQMKEIDKLRFAVLDQLKKI